MCETTRNFSNTIRTERKPNDNKTREIKSKFLGVFNSLGKRTVRYENPVLLNNPLQAKNQLPPKTQKESSTLAFQNDQYKQNYKTKKEGAERSN